jgi:hypothetical protein
VEVMSLLWERAVYREEYAMISSRLVVEWNEFHG